MTRCGLFDAYSATKRRLKAMCIVLDQDGRAYSRRSSVETRCLYFSKTSWGISRNKSFGSSKLRIVRGCFDIIFGSGSPFPVSYRNDRVSYNGNFGSIYIFIIKTEVVVNRVNCSVTCFQKLRLEMRCLVIAVFETDPSAISKSW